MAKELGKTKKPRNAGGSEGGYRNGVPSKLVQRDLCCGKAPADQFAPTPAEPVRQRYKMAGGC